MGQKRKGSQDLVEGLAKRHRRNPKGCAFLPLSHAYRRLGLYEKALEVCRSGLRHHPEFSSARAALGVLLFESGEFDKAREELESARKASPLNLLARRLLAELYVRNGNKEGAIQELQGILALAAGDSRAKTALDALSPGAGALESRAGRGGEASLRERSAVGGRVSASGLASVRTHAAGPPGEPPAQSEEGEGPQSDEEVWGVIPRSEGPEEIGGGGGASGGRTMEVGEGPEALPAGPWPMGTKKERGATPSYGSPEEGTLLAPLEDPLPLNDPLYTQSLARAYEEQGYYREALGTYRTLLRRSPEDEGLKKKVREMEGLLKSGIERKTGALDEPEWSSLEDVGVEMESTGSEPAEISLVEEPSLPLEAVDPLEGGEGLPPELEALPEDSSLERLEGPGPLFPKEGGEFDEIPKEVGLQKGLEEVSREAGGAPPPSAPAADPAEPLVFIGRMYEEEGTWSLALDFYEKALRLHPGHAGLRARRELALAEVSKGRSPAPPEGEGHPAEGPPPERREEAGLSDGGSVEGLDALLRKMKSLRTEGLS